jgi:wyosine [tRNA(Phe)-imidazoG37] synthetase (radical SAM superfamily)
MYKHLFGPVPSRRLGMSLGVDMVPKKVCSLDCIYCEVGKTTNLTAQRTEYVPAHEIIAELEDFFQEPSRSGGHYLFRIRRAYVEQRYWAGHRLYKEHKASVAIGFADKRHAAL